MAVAQKTGIPKWVARSVSGNMGTKACGASPSDRLILSHGHLGSLELSKASSDPKGGNQQRALRPQRRRLNLAKEHPKQGYPLSRAPPKKWGARLFKNTRFGCLQREMNRTKKHPVGIMGPLFL